MEAFERLKAALADRYTIERKRGAGGMADVYLTHDIRHKRKVAIKVVHPELAQLVGVERFLREIETPDGGELIFSSERPFFDLYRRAAGATRPEEPILTGSYDHYTGAVSRDGRTFPFVLAAPGGGEIWTVSLKGPANASRYFSSTDPGTRSWR